MLYGMSLGASASTAEDGGEEEGGGEGEFGVRVVDVHKRVRVFFSVSLSFL